MKVPDLPSPPNQSFGLNYKCAVVGNLLKDRHNVEILRKDLCFVHAHLSTNAKSENWKSHSQLLHPIVYVEVNSLILTALRSKFPEFIKPFKLCISD